MSELGLLVGRKAHQSSGPVNLAGSQSRERQLLRRLDPWRQVAQSFAAPERTAKLSDLQWLGQHNSELLWPEVFRTPFGRKPDLHLSIVSANCAAGEWQKWVHSRRDWLRATIGPRPLCPESDHSRHESEMARWAKLRHTQCSKERLIRSPRWRWPAATGERSGRAP